MAQQNTSETMAALEQEDDIRTMDVRSTDSEWDYVVWVHGMLRTSGPAPDPVQFHEAEGNLRAELHGSTENSDAYHVEVLD